jgi:hypothetical protein
MDHPLIDLINAKIKAAEAEGAFDDLEGAGQPLPDCDDPENALIHRVMRENGAEPEFVVLSRELAALRAQLMDSSDRDERRALIAQIAVLETRREQALRG